MQVLDVEHRISSRRERLKDASLASHRALEQSVDLDEALTSLATWHRHVQAMRVARGTLEQAWSAPSGNVQPAYSRFCISAELDADAGASGVTSARLASMVLPDDISSDAGRWGATYVFAGSSLGGRQMLARVEAAGIDVTQHARHLIRQAETSREFKSFIIELDRAPLSAAGEAQCLAAVRFTFEHLRDLYVAAKHTGAEVEHVGNA